MAGQPRKLSVSLSRAALFALDEIWDWNARRDSADHADRYIAFLTDETNKLAAAYFKGKPVPRQPRLSYIVIRRRGKAMAIWPCMN
jgi:plasmid stabilization system protein ParE